MNQPVHIACAADSNYLQHTYTMLFSLLKNNTFNIVLHCFSSDYSTHDKAQINQLTKEFKHCSIQFYAIDNNVFNGFVITHHITLATYYRIIIPELLNQNIDKIIYLDCDMIIDGNIHTLWETNLNNCIVAAVAEPAFNDFKRLNLQAADGYFNAGMLVIDLIRWRKNNLTKTIIQYIQNNLDKIIFWDQDALNACLKGQWKKLPPVYNQQSALFQISNKLLLNNYSANELAMAAKNPIIIHYTGSSKPWHLLNYNPFGYKYTQYLKHTPFAKNKIKFGPGLQLKKWLIYFITPEFKKKFKLV